MREGGRAEGKVKRDCSIYEMKEARRRTAHAQTCSALRQAEGVEGRGRGRGTRGGVTLGNRLPPEHTQ